jgi:hypothetical protein
MHWLRYAAILFVMVATGCSHGDLGATLDQELPLLGHRNWIVIADAAYPDQTAEGIETVYVGGDQLDAVAKVLKRIESLKHVRPEPLLDAELEAVSERDAPGITQYRERLDKLLKPYASKRTAPHEEIIDQLEDEAKTFRVLILKTDLALPYTTVFLQLNCGYWSDEAEQRLRKALEPDTKTQPAQDTK